MKNKLIELIEQLKYSLQLSYTKQEQDGGDYWEVQARINTLEEVIEKLEEIVE